MHVAELHVARYISKRATCERATCNDYPIPIIQIPTISDLNGTSVCILGFGREGQATLRAVQEFAPDAHITIADGNVECKMQNAELSDDIEWQVGDSYLNNLDRLDWIIKSPGIPPQPEFEGLADRITNSTQIFLQTVKEKGSTVIGITGTKGKSTTASLIYTMLKATQPTNQLTNKPVYSFLVGNIGIPTLDFLKDAGPNTIFVQEMSSYQLMDCTVSPDIAVITPIFPDHLDYHGTYEEYVRCKAHIADHQTPEGIIFYDETNEGSTQIANRSAGTKVGYTKDDAPISIEETHLIGDHNLRNIAAAWKVCEHLGCDKELAREAIKTFEGLPHRLQSLGVHHGFEWVDDAISTTPESTIAALEALGGRVKVIILGGQDRGYDFSELGRVIAHSSIEQVILFPESGGRIREAIENSGAGSGPIVFDEVESMEEAISQILKSHSDHGPGPAIALLSTASPSYNMFKNFEEKGDLFAKYIREA